MTKWILTLLVFPLTLVASEAKPNFVFLLVDDLGRGDFGCYGAEFYETPHIDQLADDGMIFSDAYAACTVCSPSRAAILTGCYPARLKLTDWIAGHQRPYAKLAVPDWNMRVDHERTTLPEALKEAGYATAFFGKWHLMPHQDADRLDHLPTAHGFDLNVGGCEWGQPKGKGRYFSPFEMPNLDDGAPGDFLTDALTDAALDYLDSSSRDQPFLLYFSYYTLHGPTMCPPDLEEKYRKKAEGFDNRKNEYLKPDRAGMVECLDNSVGRIVSKLEELGIADNTVIILTGDNGGNYAENSGGLKGFKGYAHEGGVREPLIVTWPGTTTPGSSSDEPVIGTDFFPTMLEMAGVPLLPAVHPDGETLVPLLTGTSETLPRETLYWHYPHYHRTKPYGAIRHGDWKLIEFFEDGALELYDLDQDVAEENNLASENPEKAADLLKRLKDWRQSVDAQMMSENPNYDPQREDERPGRRKKKRS